MAKSVTFEPGLLGRLQAFAAERYQGNLSRCINDLLRHELSAEDRASAWERIAQLRGDPEPTADEIARIDRWLDETAARVSAKKTEARRTAGS